MPKRKSFAEQLETWTFQDRIDKAREVTKELTYRVQHVIELHTANEIIIYSDQLSKQIPCSRAASAFNVFVDAQFRMEIIRLVSLWDKSEANAVSIPTVIALIDDERVIRQLAEDIRQAYLRGGVQNLNPREDDPRRDTISEAMNALHQEFADERSIISNDAILKAIASVKITAKKIEVEAVRNLRDWSSHSLTKKGRELNGFDRNMKYGDEKKLLNTTVELIEALYCHVNGTSFDISGDCFRIARDKTEKLWNNCRFDISER